MCQPACRLRRRWWCLLCQLASWFNGYCLVRTYSNSMEALLTAAGAYHWLSCCSSDADAPMGSKGRQAEQQQQQQQQPSERLVQPRAAAPCRLRRRHHQLAWVACAALCVVVRPSSALFWALPAGLQLARLRGRALLTLLTDAASVGGGLLGGAALVDRLAYQRWVGRGRGRAGVRASGAGKLWVGWAERVPTVRGERAALCLVSSCHHLPSSPVDHCSWVAVPWQFLRFNLLAGGSAQYGSHPWHWNLTQGLPVVSASLLPLLALGLWWGAGGSRWVGGSVACDMLPSSFPPPLPEPSPLLLPCILGAAQAAGAAGRLVAGDVQPAGPQGVSLPAARAAAADAALRPRGAAPAERQPPPCYPPSTASKCKGAGSRRAVLLPAWRRCRACARSCCCAGAPRPACFCSCPWRHTSCSFTRGEWVGRRWGNT